MLASDIEDFLLTVLCHRLSMPSHKRACLGQPMQSKWAFKEMILALRAYAEHPPY